MGWQGTITMQTANWFGELKTLRFYSCMKCRVKFTRQLMMVPSQREMEGLNVAVWVPIVIKHQVLQIHRLYAHNEK